MFESAAWWAISPRATIWCWLTLDSCEVVAFARTPIMNTGFGLKLRVALSWCQRVMYAPLCVVLLWEID